MIKALIIEDEPKSLANLVATLKDIRPDIDVLATANSEASAVKLINQLKGEIDLVFMDIQLEQGNGFSVLQQLQDIDFRIIFVTAFDSFAIRAIKFSALDYLLKPVDPTELNEALLNFDKTRNNEQLNVFKKSVKNKSFFEKLAVPTLNDVKFIAVSKILYLESEKSYTTIYLDDKSKLVSSRNIGYYEELLEDAFFRCHNSYLVNLSKINRFIKGKNGLLELDGGIKIEVSARRKNDLIQILGM